VSSSAIDKPTPLGLAAGDFPWLGRAAGGIWFLLLALLYARVLPALIDDALASGGAFAGWAPVVSRVCTLTFFLTLAWLMVARPPPLARQPGLGAQIIALAGTYGTWVVGFLPQATLPPALTILAAAVTLVGSALIVFTVLHLGRSFSIVPQARALVTRGPYSLVRHPLYAAEEIALIGVAMHVVWYAAVPFILIHVALQLRRMNYEEQLLGEVFPRYEAYASRTARWVPGIW
jgi:protein-S-isoprenylcysteine O-methyltransferase Ste14